MTEEANPLLDQAIEAILEKQCVSVSYLQRRLRIGYSRAADLIEQMEACGIIGPALEGQPREILVKEN